MLDKGVKLNPINRNPLSAVSHAENFIFYWRKFCSNFIQSGTVGKCVRELIPQHKILCVFLVLFPPRCDGFLGEEKLES
jgi:hypothetical protein